MRNALISLGSAGIDVLSRAAPWSSRALFAKPQAAILRGREAISAKSGMLDALCERTGQAGVMHWLDYQMGKPTEAKKIPTLLLMGLKEEIAPADATADDVRGAVLLYEYAVAGWGTKIFATDDMAGLGTVVAPKAKRIQIAEEASSQLMEAGALATLMTVPSGEGCVQPKQVAAPLAPLYRMARQTRSVPLGLKLGETLEQTLAALGKHTRRNLRYYRRRLESDLGSQYVAQVQMSREEFLAFNRASMNPASEQWTRWRYESSDNGPGMMFAGMRTRDGQWLSLIGGRRHRNTIYIDWQMNRAGLTRYSLSTVMRSYLLEHETTLGTKDMVFTGGTPHSMRHSFACVGVTDVVAVRRSAAGAMVRRLAQRMPDNFLAMTLCNPKLQWE